MKNLAAALAVVGIWLGIGMLGLGGVNEIAIVIVSLFAFPATAITVACLSEK